MKVYVSVAHKGEENTPHTEELCAAVREAGLVDYCFTRDALKYKNKIKDPKDLWAKVKDEIGACDALLVDVSGHPTSGRLVEMGIAYALNKPVIVVERKGSHHKELFYGVSSEIIKYTDFIHLSEQLKMYDNERVFGTTDRFVMLGMFLAVGGVFGYLLAQLWIPLGVIGAIAYWFAVRHLFAPMRAYDRLVILIPLVAVWIVGFYFLRPVYLPLALAWLIGFWIVTVPVLQRLKFSL